MLLGIVLAAGNSTRFGSNKLLYKLKNGLPMVIQSAQTLSSAVDDLIIVINGKDPDLALLLQQRGYKTLISVNCEHGIGNSIADAVNVTEHADGWLVTLGDMPFISPLTMQCVAQHFYQSNAICAPYSNGNRGHPIVFPARYKNSLMQLSGDVGARALLHNYAQDVVRIEVEDKNILIDIDTLKCLQAAE